MNDIHKILRSYALSGKSFKEKFSEILKTYGVGDVSHAFLAYENWVVKKMLSGTESHEPKIIVAEAE